MHLVKKGAQCVLYYINTYIKNKTGTQQKESPFRCSPPTVELRNNVFAIFLSTPLRALSINSTCNACTLASQWLLVPLSNYQLHMISSRAIVKRKINRSLQKQKIDVLSGARLHSCAGYMWNRRHGILLFFFFSPFVYMRLCVYESCTEKIRSAKQ